MPSTLTDLGSLILLPRGGMILLVKQYQPGPKPAKNFHTGLDRHYWAKISKSEKEDVKKKFGTQVAI